MKLRTLIRKEIEQINLGLKSLLNDWIDKIPEEDVSGSGHKFKCQKHWLQGISGYISSVDELLPESTKDQNYILKMQEAVKFIDEYRARPINHAKGYKVTTEDDIKKGNILLNYFIYKTKEVLT